MPTEYEVTEDTLTTAENGNDNILERSRIKVGLIKFIVGTIAGSVISASLAFIINWQKVKIEQAKNKHQIILAEEKNLREYFRYTLEVDAYDRLTLSLFMSEILSDEDARNRWKSFHDKVENLLTRYAELSFELSEIETQDVKEASQEERKQYFTKVEELNRLMKQLKPLKLPSIEREPETAVSAAPSRLYLDVTKFVNGEYLSILKDKKWTALDLFNKMVSGQDEASQYEFVKELVSGFGFPFQTEPGVVNLIALRKLKTVNDMFDDVLIVVWKDKTGKKHLRAFDATTEAGSYWYENPVNIGGTAEIIEGYHPEIWRLGLHRGRYQALVQNKEVQIIRWRNNQVVGTEKGFFGLNLHRASASKKSTMVGKWSAGTIAIADPKDFAELMAILIEAAEIQGRVFSLVLIALKCEL